MMKKIECNNRKYESSFFGGTVCTFSFLIQPREFGGQIKKETKLPLCDVSFNGQKCYSSDAGKEVKQLTETLHDLIRHVFFFFL